MDEIESEEWRGESFLLVLMVMHGKENYLSKNLQTEVFERQRWPVPELPDVNCRIAFPVLS
jgi:hypothetical protein